MNNNILTVVLMVLVCFFSLHLTLFEEETSLWSLVAVGSVSLFVVCRHLRQSYIRERNVYNTSNTDHDIHIE